MKFKTLILFLNLIMTSLAWGGNGVERGSSIINDSIINNPSIEAYLENQLSKCHLGGRGESFAIEDMSIERVKIDGGITDQLYQIQISHLNKELREINEIKINILDTDFHNWRQYEERLSSNITFDKNNFCH